MGNSVIYRPAYDAEVEYLESTGTQWIDTGFIPDDTCGLYVRAYPHNASLQKKVVGCGSTVQSSESRWWINFAHTGKLEICWNAYNETIQYNKNQWYEVTNNFLNSRTGTVDGVTQNVSYPTLRNNNYTAYIFNVNSNVPNAFVGKISSVKFSRGSEIVMDFIPVRIGSVGYLYDKVSKQLFANKGTGQFTLGSDVSNAVIPQQRCVLYFGNQRNVGFEKIYEEYEWLVGHAKQTTFPSPGADIRLDIPISLTDKVATITMGSTCRNIQINGSSVDGYQYMIPIWSYASGETWIQERHGNDNTIHSIRAYLSDTKKTITLDFKNKVATVGSQSFNISGVGYKFQRFYSSYWSRTRTVGNITIDNELNLVPCRLLHSIPAILDGNGIARQAGECGMWDKISNRFYGNVGNSGTFTVEGAKCYEEYKWLVGDGVAAMSVTINYAYDVVDYGDIKFFNTTDKEGLFLNVIRSTDKWIKLYLKYDNSNQLRFAWHGGGNDSAVSLEDGTLVIESKNRGTNQFNGRVINNSNTYNITDAWYIPDENYLNGAVSAPKNVGISKIEVKNRNTGVVGTSRFPCKLTHGIPASMDANGIARPAGTCGMWDKVNDKFYGNVNSSGSFTVSND